MKNERPIPRFISERFDRAIERIDAENASDPTMEELNGKSVPASLLYGHRMSARLVAFAPDASEAASIAVRAQHIRRWEIPRADFPMDRLGYRRWRTALARYHGELVRVILTETGYSADEADKVAALVQKQRIKKDPEAQLIEDIACLVFLEHYFDDFAVKHEPEKVVSILQKTWVKMSSAARRAALELPLSDSSAALISRALGTSAAD